MADKDLIRQLHGSALTTAEIHYCMRDYPSLLQLFIWQEYDEAPDFPALRLFLEHWRRDVDTRLHSVRVAHRRNIGPGLALSRRSQSNLTVSLTDKEAIQ